MTIYGIGAFIGAMLLVAPLRGLFGGYTLFAVASGFWLLVMSWLWIHFYRAARQATLAPSNTRLFHAIQFVALALAAIPFLFGHGPRVGTILFTAITGVAAVSLTVFFVCHIFLAITLRQHLPRVAFAGLLFSAIGLYFSWGHLLKIMQ